MRHLLTALLLLLAASATARRESTRAPGPLRPIVTEHSRLFDTIPVPAGNDSNDSTAAVIIRGYDKEARARKEQMFVTSLLTADTIECLIVKLEYYDEEGRMLHSRTDSLTALALPPGQTRCATLPSWDHTGTFRYRYSNVPRRLASTPYNVRVTPLLYTRRRQPAR